VGMPTPAAVGKYRLQLQVTDDSGNVSQPAIITLTVIDNQAPTAVLSATDSSGAPLNNNQLPYGSGFILDGSHSTDIGSSIATYTWASLDATIGTLTVNTPVVTTTPTLAVNMPTPVAVGHYRLQLQVTDDSGNVSQPAIITLTVIMINNAPQANDDTYITDEDTPLTVVAPGVLANDSDVDGDVLVVATLIDSPVYGSLTLNSDGSFSYTPDADFNGDDSFSYVASDGFAGSNIATVTITVSPVNDAPVALDDNYMTDEDTSLTILVPSILTNDSDVDGDGLTAVLVSGPLSGSLTLNVDGTFGYTPNSNFNGDDSFSYVANDGSVDSNPATVTVTVNAVNDAPVASVTTATPDIPLGQMALFDGSASYDPEGQTISYQWQIISAPIDSSAMLTSANAATTGLLPDQMGQYTIGLVVNDGLADSAQDTVIINVTANLPPVAAATGTPTSGDSPLAVAFAAGGSIDPEGGTLTYSWDFGDPASTDNTSTLVAPTHVYANPGTYTAIVTATDDYGNTDQAAVEIIVNAPNLPPTVLPVATPSSGPAPLVVQFSAGASDPDNDPLSIQWDFGDGGSSTLADPNHVYSTPGLYTATATVSDGVNPPVSASVTVDVSTGVADCSIEVEEYKLNRGGKHDVNGKVTLDLSFDCGGMPTTGDAIRVEFDGVELAAVPFGNFREKKPGQYEYKGRGLRFELDFNKSRLQISRHRLRLDGVDERNGIEVLVAFGTATAVDTIKDSDIEHDDDSDGDRDSRDRRDRGKSKESWHKKRAGDD